MVRPVDERYRQMSTASARAARAERRTLQRAGARCVGTRGECCAFWHGLGASSSFAVDRDVFIAGAVPTRPTAAHLGVCCGDKEVSNSDFRQPSARAWWWDNWKALSAEKHPGGLTHWHVYCGSCGECCVLCHEPNECGCDEASSVCAACRRDFG